jgi:hypothetical protein
MYANQDASRTGDPFNRNDPIYSLDMNDRSILSKGAILKIQNWASLNKTHYAIWWLPIFEFTYMPDRLCAGKQARNLNFYRLVMKICTLAQNQYLTRIIF